MTEPIIKINDKEYQDIEIYNQLYEEHQKLLGQTKETQKPKDDGIMNNSNTCMFIKSESEHFEGDILKLNKPKLTFKRMMSYDDDKLYFTKELFLFFLNNKRNKYNIEYKRDFDRIISGFDNTKRIKNTTPDIYVSYNEEKNEYKQENPVCLVYNNYIMLIAPIIDNEE